MVRLTFKKKTDYNEWGVWKKKDFLGDIAQRIIYGKNQFWFFPDNFMMPGDMWFSQDCLREIADFMDSLTVQIASKEESHE
jgi:hypothetical protein